ncbi:hypothetical protein BC828DRAFT_382894 [Blastocladiella britannica]|nr:hypothetical protein BC828DRAFT_382894 [Blastocladiella britannica]
MALPLAALPDLVLDRLAPYLSPLSAARLRSTCRSMRSAVALTPFLDLRLLYALRHCPWPTARTLLVAAIAAGTPLDPSLISRALARALEAHDAMTVARVFFAADAPLATHPAVETARYRRWPLLAALVNGHRTASLATVIRALHAAGPGWTAALVLNTMSNAWFPAISAALAVLDSTVPQLVPPPLLPSLSLPSFHELDDDPAHHPEWPLRLLIDCALGRSGAVAARLAHRPFDTLDLDPCPYFDVAIFNNHAEVFVTFVAHDAVERARTRHWPDPPALHAYNALFASLDAASLDVAAAIARVPRLWTSADPGVRATVDAMRASTPESARVALRALLAPGDDDRHPWVARAASAMAARWRRDFDRETARDLEHELRAALDADPALANWWTLESYVAPLLAAGDARLAAWHVPRLAHLHATTGHPVATVVVGKAMASGHIGVMRWALRDLPTTLDIASSGLPLSSSTLLSSTTAGAPMALDHVPSRPLLMATPFQPPPPSPPHSSPPRRPQAPPTISSTARSAIRGLSREYLVSQLISPALDPQRAVRALEWLYFDPYSDVRQLAAATGLPDLCTADPNVLATSMRSAGRVGWAAGWMAMRAGWNADRAASQVLVQAARDLARTGDEDECDGDGIDDDEDDGDGGAAMDVDGADTGAAHAHDDPSRRRPAGSTVDESAWRNDADDWFPRGYEWVGRRRLCIAVLGLDHGLESSL